MVVVGSDVHKRTHTFVAVDEVGRKLGEKTVKATPEGHDKAISWARERFGAQLLWAVEDCRHLSARLELDLLDAGERVVRVPPKLMAEQRRTARTRGKSDPIDALAVTRAALREPDLLVTTLPDGTVTLWAFTVRVLDMPQSGDVNPVAVVERFLVAEQDAGVPELADADLMETFCTRDGRDGVAIHASVAAPLPVEAEVPGTDPEALGVVYAAMRLRRPPGAAVDRLVLVTGVSPNVGQRLPMAVVAAGLTLSAQVRADGEKPPPGRIDIDPTGRYETRHEG